MITLYIYKNQSKSKTTIYRDTYWTKNRPGIDLKIRPLLLKIKPHIGLKIRPLLLKIEPGIGLKIGGIGLKIALILTRACQFV